MLCTAASTSDQRLRITMPSKRNRGTPPLSCILPVPSLKKEEGDANDLRYETVSLNSNQVEQMKKKDGGKKNGKTKKSTKMRAATKVPGLFKECRRRYKKDEGKK